MRRAVTAMRSGVMASFTGVRGGLTGLSESLRLCTWNFPFLDAAFFDLFSVNRRGIMHLTEAGLGDFPLSFSGVFRVLLYLGIWRIVYRRLKCKSNPP